MKNNIHQPALWVYLCAMLPSFNGSYISAGTLVSFFHNAVGYVTGNIALSGAYIAYHEYVFFLLGAIAGVVMFKILNAWSLIGSLIIYLIIMTLNHLTQD